MKQENKFYFNTTFNINTNSQTQVVLRDSSPGIGITVHTLVYQPLVMYKRTIVVLFIIKLLVSVKQKLSECFKYVTPKK